MAVSNGLKRTVTKIYRVGHELCAFAGGAANGMSMIEWARGGFKQDKFPDSQLDKEEWSTFVVIGAEGVRIYENNPTPIRFEDKQFATGSGRDYALAAMHLGKTAAEAVEVACRFDNGCGNGVDSLELIMKKEHIPAKKMPGKKGKKC